MIIARFVDTAQHMFSGAERDTVQSICDATEPEVRYFLPELRADIDLIVIESGAFVIPETGCSGASEAPGRVQWTVDATREDGVEQIATAWLRLTLFHLLHYQVRGWVMSGGEAIDPATSTIMKGVVASGMATAFERDAGGGQPLWGQYPSEVRDWVKELMALPLTSNYVQWMFQHPDGRRWIGYRAGTFIVDQAMANSGQSAAQLVRVPTAKVLEFARVADAAVAGCPTRARSRRSLRSPGSAAALGRRGLKETNRVPQVFVSHVKEDAPVAVEIAAGLEAAGFVTWYYERDSVPGVSYLVQVGEAIDRSAAVVLMVSRASLGSHQVTTEVVRAYEAKKAILPITIDVSHDGFQRRQPEWRTAIGAATSIALKSRDTASVITALVAGLGWLGIEASTDAVSAENPAPNVSIAARRPRMDVPEEPRSASAPQDHATTQVEVLHFKLDWTEPPYTTMTLHIDQPLFKHFPGEWFREEHQPNAPDFYRLLLRGPGIVSVCRQSPYELLMGKADLAQLPIVRQHIQKSLQVAFGAQQVLHVESRMKPSKGGGSRKRGTA